MVSSLNHLPPWEMLTFLLCSFVCAVDSADMRFSDLLRSYPAPGYDAINCEIWEAARATSAAPTFFKKMTIKIRGGTTLHFVDGGLKCNNPVAAVLEEAENVFGMNQRIGCIVSLGCGLKSAIEVKKPFGYQRLLPLSLVKALGDIATDCQGAADSMAKRFRTRQSFYFRLNATNVGNLSLAEWKSMDKIVSHTRTYCKGPEVDAFINELVEILASRGAVQERESGFLTLAQICEL